MSSSSYQRFSGICGILAGICGLLYLVFFLVYRDPAALLPSLALLAVGLLAPAALVGLYQRVRSIEDGFALLGLLFGFVGAVGAAVHAAFDLANNLHAPAAAFGYPNAIDPRGFLTFAAAGIGAILLSQLLVRDPHATHAAGYLGILSGALLILLYVAYLTTLNATSPLVLGLILLSGIVQPAWYLWIGWLLVRSFGRVSPRVPSTRIR